MRYCTCSDPLWQHVSGGGTTCGRCGKKPRKDVQLVSLRKVWRK